MPIYEYRCKSCDNKFEKLRSRAEANHAAGCPRCGGGESLRLLSVFAASSNGDGACDTSRMMGGPCCRVVGGG